MGLIYGNEILKEKFEEMEEEVTLEIYVSSDMLLSIMEESAGSNIIVIDKINKVKININLINDERSVRNNSKNNNPHNVHGARIKLRTNDNKNGIPIKIKNNDGKYEIEFGTGKGELKSKEESILRTKQGKAAIRFADTNADTIIKIWNSSNKEEVYDLINSMNNKNEFEIKMKGKQQ